MNSSVAALGPGWLWSSGYQALRRRVRGHEDQPPHELRVPDRHPGRDAAAERVAHDVDLLVAQVRDQGGDVVGDGLKRDRPIHVRRAAVPLQVRRDDLAPLREPPGHRPEHLPRPEPGVVRR
jgi:hypothetical protein